MKLFYSALSIAALFCFTSVLSAQQTFDNQADWEAAICGSVVGGDIDFDSLVEESTSPFFPGTSISVFGPMLSQEWGTLSNPVGFLNIRDEVDLLPTGCLAVSQQITEAFRELAETGELPDIILEDLPPQEVLTLTPDTTQGDVEGFCIELITDDVAVNIFDGDTLVDTFTASGEAVTPDGFLVPNAGETTCWLNTNQANVTRIELVRLGSIDICSASFSFKEDFVVDAEPSCQDQLQGVIDALRVKLDSAVGYDIDWIAAAIYELESAQDPLLWASEDLLSDLGTVFFQHNFYATFYLESVEDEALVQSCLIGIQDLLGCTVDAEVEYALENPDVNTNLLAYATFFESYADSFADYEMYLNAVILHFYAWVFASNAH